MSSNKVEAGTQTLAPEQSEDQFEDQYEEAYAKFYLGLFDLIYTKRSFINMIYIEKCPDKSTYIFESAMSYLGSLNLISFDILDAVKGSYDELDQNEIELLKSDKTRFDEKLVSSFRNQIQNQGVLAREGQKLLSNKN